MIEALFSIGTIFWKTVRDVAKETVRYVIRAVAEEFGLGHRPDSAPVDPTVHIQKLKNLNAELNELRRSDQRDGHLRGAQHDDLADLQMQHRAAYQQLVNDKQAVAVEDAQRDPDGYTGTALGEETLHLLQYHSGLMRLAKNCPSCDYPMVLRYKTGRGQSFSDYFWACTRFFENDGRPNCPTMSVQPFDVRVVHKRDVPELQVRRSELDALATMPSIGQATSRRMDQHLRQEDGEILCPIHAIPMTLQRKREHNGTLLDMYFLACPNTVTGPQDWCKQKMKLKSLAEIAAFLQRSEGRGVLV